MPAAEIITIGTELLLGEILDTNTRHIARTLRDAGLDLYRTTTVGDNISRIAEVIREALVRAEIIITTGGLGPTVDDPTRDAVAAAFGVPTEYRPELWDQIVNRFARYGRQPTENNRRQAFIPQGAIPIENPVGTAPAFICEKDQRCVISLPGVPREMEHLLEQAVLPYLRSRYGLSGVILARVLHTASVGESQIDETIDDLERLENPTVGLAAHPGQIDIRITAKAPSPEAAEALIGPLAAEIRTRLGEMIFGQDEQTLAQVTLDRLADRGMRLAVVEAGLRGTLANISGGHPAWAGAELIPSPAEFSALRERALAFGAAQGAQAVLAAGLTNHGDQQELILFLKLNELETSTRRSYGGPPQNAPIWAANNALDLIRRTLLNEHLGKVV